MSDLKLIVDLSCARLETVEFFVDFHKALLSVLYDATDVSIEYQKKSIYMNLPTDFSRGDFLEQYDELVPSSIGVNVDYDSLQIFLKGSIDEVGARLDSDFSHLYASFAKARAKLVEAQLVLEIQS